MAAKKDFDFKKLSKKLDKIYVDALNQLGNHINKAIQDGIDSSTDIHGNAFVPMKQITKDLGGTKLLNRTGKMKQTRKKPATTSKPTFTLPAPTKYGAYHNTGFTQTNPKQWFYGAKVPDKPPYKREWFGIPKDAKPGGTRYKKMVLDIKNRIRSGFKTQLKKIV